MIAFYRLQRNKQIVFILDMQLQNVGYPIKLISCTVNMLPHDIQTTVCKHLDASAAP